MKNILIEFTADNEQYFPGRSSIEYFHGPYIGTGSNEKEAYLNSVEGAAVDGLNVDGLPAEMGDPSRDLNFYFGPADADVDPAENEDLFVYCIIYVFDERFTIAALAIWECICDPYDSEKKRVAAHLLGIDNFDYAIPMEVGDQLRQIGVGSTGVVYDYSGENRIFGCPLNLDAWLFRKFQTLMQCPQIKRGVVAHIAEYGKKWNII